MKKILSLGILGLALSASSAYAQLSGVKTINPNGSGANNYTSFTAAVNALKVAGVNGAVTFNVAAGVYAERVVIDSAATAGASATNQIIFRKDPAAATNPLFRAHVTTGVAGEIEFIRMANAKWVTIDGIDFQPMGISVTGVTPSEADSNTVAAIRFTALQHCTFKNFTIRGTGLYNARGINSGNFNASDRNLGGKTPTRYVTIENIRVVKVPNRCIQFFGDYTGADGTDGNQWQHVNRDRYNKVINCTIDSSGLQSGSVGVSTSSQGMLLLGQDSMTVTGNVIKNTIHTPTTVPYAGSYHAGIMLRSNPAQGYATGNILSNNTYSGAYGTEHIYGLCIWRNVGTVAQNNIVENIEASAVYGIFNNFNNAGLVVSKNKINNLKRFDDYGYNDNVACGILSVGDSLNSLYTENSVSNIRSDGEGEQGDDVIGIDIQNSISSWFTGNVIENVHTEGYAYNLPVTGIRVSAAEVKSSRPKGGVVYVTNNFVSKIYQDSADHNNNTSPRNIAAYGIKSVRYTTGSGGRQYIAHNTVVMNRPAGQATNIAHPTVAVYVFGKNPQSDSIIVENNLLVNYNTHPNNSDTSYALQFAGGATLVAKGNNYVGINGTNVFPVKDTTRAYPNLHDWITAGMETNADSAAVDFVNLANGDLHLTAANYSNARLLKTPVSYVTKDIDGANRSATNTSVGADAEGSSTNVTPTLLGNNTFCIGQSTTLSVANPASNLTYLWSNGATGTSINVSNAGSYSVQAVSACCTSAVSNIIVVSVTSTINTPTTLANGATTFCGGGSVELSVQNPAANTTYLWSTGATTQSITVSVNGRYTVRAISGSCTSAVSAATEVNVLPAPSTPTISASGATTLALGESVVLTSSVADAYLWSNGATTRSISVSTSGSFSVQAIANSCTSAVSSPVAVTANNIVNVTACDAPPVAIDFARLGSTVCYLSWTANTNATNYRVFWKKTDASAYFASPIYDASKLAYKIENMSPNTDYQLYLAVLCSSTGTWSNSPIIPFKTKDELCTPPTITPSAIGKNTVRFSGFTFAGIAYYSLQWRAVGTSTWLGNTVTTSTFDAKKLLAGTAYNFRVRAICANANNDMTPYVNGNFTTAAATACAAPTPTSSAQTLNSITVNWNTVDASSYTIRWQVQGASSWFAPVTVSGNSHTITGLSAGVTYNVQVQAKCNPLAEMSDYSASLSVTTNSSSTCATPAIDSLKASVTRSVSAFWTPTTNIAQYEISRRSVGGTWNAPNTVAGTASTFNMPSTWFATSFGNDFEVRMRAKCADNGLWAAYQYKTITLAGSARLGMTENTITSIYPNPSTGTVNLEVSENIIDHNATYTVTNALGQVIKSGAILETKTTLQLSQGVYFLQVNSREGVATKQVVVQ